MYDEVKDYKKGMWKRFSVHDEDNIKGMFGPYRWMSNMWAAECKFEGVMYKSSEAAYQAAKLIPELRQPFTQMNGYDSKKAWNEAEKTFPEEAILPDWDDRKYEVMSAVVFDKFKRSDELRQKLLDTGDKYIEESNWWSDCFWGVDARKGGENNLGKILMDIRTFFKNEELT